VKQTKFLTNAYCFNARRLSNLERKIPMTTMMQGSPPIAPSRPLSPSLLSYESEIFWHTLIQTGPPLAFDLKNILKNYSLNEWYFDEAIIFYVPGLLIFPDASEHAC
jgi:hypothetical protein